MVNRLLDFLRRKPKLDARATYGPEPYRLASNVSIAERATSVLDGSTKYLLREVIGLEAFRRVPEALLPSRFARELPLTAIQLEEHVSKHGLPKGFGGVEIRQEGEEWQLIVVDRLPEIRGVYASEIAAQIATVRLCRAALEPYLVGRLHER